MEEEFQNKINFLDITISKDENNIEFNLTENPVQLILSPKAIHTSP